ncbi:hypothetical protein [Actinoplanes sp. URMC 104]|uniref:hypothetical protein n=1 Tax=Actinoplanes sp. URMC 104 TaxID=3423409 RepID=UPI003F1AB697
MTLIDRDLVMALSELDEHALRDVARWAALRALSVAGITDHRVVAPAVAALRGGEPLPAPFDEESGWYAVTDAIGDRTHVPYLPVFEPQSRTEESVQQFSALSALNCTAIGDPLAAAVSAIESAATTVGPDEYLQFLADIRVTFPILQGRRPADDFDGSDESLALRTVPVRPAHHLPESPAEQPNRTAAASLTVPPLRHTLARDPSTEHCRRQMCVRLVDKGRVMGARHDKAGRIKSMSDDEVVYRRSPWRHALAVYAAFVVALSAALLLAALTFYVLSDGPTLPRLLPHAAASVVVLLLLPFVQLRPARRVPPTIRFAASEIELGASHCDAVAVPYNIIVCARTRGFWPLTTLQITVDQADRHRVVRIDRDGLRPPGWRWRGKLHFTMQTDGLTASPSAIRSELQTRGLQGNARGRRRGWTTPNTRS